MLNRVLGALALALAVTAGSASAQTATPAAKEPQSRGRPLSEWIADLKAAAPVIRNAAAYEIAGLGPAGAPAVPGADRGARRSGGGSAVSRHRGPG